MRKLQYACIVLSLAILFSCKQKDPNIFTVKGKMQNANSEMILLERVHETGTDAVDSTLLADDGSFSLTGETSIPAFYSLSLARDNNISLIIAPGDDIHINGNATDMRSSYSIEGSYDSELLKELNDKFTFYYEKLLVLNNRYNDFMAKEDHSGISELREELDSAYYEIKKQYKDYLIQFIDKNTSSLASFSALYQRISPHDYLLDPFEDITYYEKVDSAFKVHHPHSDVTRYMSESMVQIKEQIKYEEQKTKQLTFGSVAPEISLPGPDGEVISLSSLRGKYVLLDFWAAWCTPCRTENPNLVKIYRKYARKGFTIFQVSLDRDKKSWVNAIKDDQLGNWTHVSDLKFWNSVVVPVYNIHEIPANFLLDKQGRIIAKNLRGAVLEKKLQEIFQ